MSIFNGTRLAPGIFQLDTARLASGWYSDTYFSNSATLLDTLAATDYRLPAGTQPEVAVGDLEVEMQVFTRRKPMVVVAGVDEALAVLQAATGVWEAGTFHNTAHTLQVEAVQDGVVVPYGGDPRRVLPVLRIRG